MIHLRTVTDSSGDAIEHLWFCSQFCYSASFAKLPETKPHGRDPDCVACQLLAYGACDFHSRVIDGVEIGGAYPCGAESDTLDYCAQCGAIVGNPLTDHGTAELPDIVLKLASYGDDDSLSRASEIIREYDYAIPEYVRRYVTKQTMRAYMERGYN